MKSKALLIVTVLCIFLFAPVVFASESNDVIQVSTSEELRAAIGPAMLSNGTIQLMNDIEHDRAFGFSSGIITIDLNGFILNVSTEVENMSAISLGGDAQLLLTGQGAMNVSSKSGTAISARDDSKIMVNDVHSGGSTAVRVWNNAHVVINGDVTNEYAQGISVTDNASAVVYGNVRAATMAVYLYDNAVFHMTGNAVSDTVISVMAEGAGVTAVIYGNIEGIGGISLLYGANAEITGNIVGKEWPAVHLNHTGTHISVRGNVYAHAYNTAVTAARGATVDIVGNISAVRGSGASASGIGTSVTISGNVNTQGFSTAVSASEGALMNITGNLNPEQGSSITANGINTRVMLRGDAMERVSASEGALIEVNGNISSEHVGASAYGAGTQIIVYGNIIGSVLADAGAFLEINGNVSQRFTSVRATDENTRVLIRGNITGGVFVEYGVSIVIYGNISSESRALIANNGATVRVNGNITTNVGPAINAYTESTTVHIYGDVRGGTIGVSAFAGAHVYVFGDVHSSSVGITAVEATVTVVGNVYSNSLGIKNGNADVSIYGDIIARNRFIYFIGPEVIVEILAIVEGIVTIEITDTEQDKSEIIEAQFVIIFNMMLNIQTFRFVAQDEYTEIVDGYYIYTFWGGIVRVNNIYELPQVQNDASVLRFVIGATTFTQDGRMYTLDAAPFIQDDRTMVPLRVVAEAFDATDLNMRDGIITFNIGGESFSMTIGVSLQGNMGVPVIVADRTFVPLAFVANAMGAGVRWNSDTRAAYVYVG